MPFPKLKPQTLTVLVILGAVMLLLYSWHMEIKPFSQGPSSRNSKVHVLLLSTFRSGSSFMGEIFSQHPDVFYLMEPVYHVWRKHQSMGAQQLQVKVMDLFRSLFHCNFSLLGSYIHDHSEVKDIPFWHRSRALCSPPACTLTPRGEFSNDGECQNVCGKEDLQLAQDTCDTYSHVVVKTVRVYELESLYPLLQDPSLDPCIIHLVRDPRAVFTSRLEVYRYLYQDDEIMLEHRNVTLDQSKYEVMKLICHSHVNIIKRAVLNPPPFLRGCYKLVRYEDVARDPLEEVNLMYDFAGLKMTEKLEERIYNLTNAKKKDDEPFNVAPHNASEVAWAWRNKLPHFQVKRIQEVCEGAMKLLGYRTVNSEEEQKDPTVNLLMPQSSIMPTLRGEG